MATRKTSWVGFCVVSEHFSITSIAASKAGLWLNAGLGLHNHFSKLDLNGNVGSGILDKYLCMLYETHECVPMDSALDLTERPLTSAPRTPIALHAFQGSILSQGGP